MTTSSLMMVYMYTLGVPQRVAIRIISVTVCIYHESTLVCRDDELNHTTFLGIILTLKPHEFNAT